jgi:hypothetical protein
MLLLPLPLLLYVSDDKSTASPESLWTARMPSAIRRERLLATMHPVASATSSVYCGSSSVRKEDLSVAAKTEVCVDALGASPDTLVHSNDVFTDPLEAPRPKSINADPSTWWWREFDTYEIMEQFNLDDFNLTSTRKQVPKAKEAIANACKFLAAVVSAVVYSIIGALLCVANAVVWLVRAVAWAMASVLQLAAGLVGAVACAAWAGAKGVVSVAACPYMCVLQLAGLLVRSVFGALVWVVCTVLKAPLYLVLAVYFAIACVLRNLIKGPVALKRAVFGSRCSHCATVVDFNACLADLSVAEICALINPHRHPWQEVW